MKWKGTQGDPKGHPTDLRSIAFQMTNTKKQRERRCQSSSMLSCVQRDKLRSNFL